MAETETGVPAATGMVAVSPVALPPPSHVQTMVPVPGDGLRDTVTPVSVCASTVSCAVPDDVVAGVTLASVGVLPLLPVVLLTVAVFVVVCDPPSVTVAVTVRFPAAGTVRSSRSVLLDVPSLALNA